MFKTNAIIREENGGFSSAANCHSPSQAEKLRSEFIGPVRQISMFADLYQNGSQLILEAPDQETMLKIMDILNHAIESF